MRADSRLLLMGLVLCGAAGACISDVEYLRAGRQSAASGGTTGSGATPGDAGSPEGGTVFESAGTGGGAGTFQTGGTSDGGKAGQGTGAGSGGVAGSTGGGGMAGMAGMVSSCGDPRIMEKFDFNDALVVVNTSSGTTKERWVKGPYDSTDTNTGKADVTASPPTNPKNLANMSTLNVDAEDGTDKPSMRYMIPFSPTPPAVEHVHLLYIFAGYGERMKVVNVSRAMLTASATLAQAPNDNCVVSANAWTTGTDALGQTFLHIDGPKVNLAAGKWVTIKMDLSTSNPPTAVNQYGFALHSTCSAPMPPAGGAGAGGDSGDSGPGGPTIVLFDNIVTHCP
jgi:hypothetical protein